MFANRLQLREAGIDAAPQNLFFFGDHDDIGARITEDVQLDVACAIASGKTYASRLAWGDLLRNVFVLEDISSCEPSVVLDIGCGNHHSIGRMIAEAGVDSIYVGIDAVHNRAKAVCDEDGSRPFIGIWHDMKKGIPMRQETVEYVTCLEAMEHFCESVADVEAFFSEVRQVLREGGRFILATPNPGNGPLLHPDCHDHEFAANEIETIAQVAGFSIEQSFNYRAKGSIARELYQKYRPRHIGMPRAFIESVEMQNWTESRELVPGNVVYVMS